MHFRFTMPRVQVNDLSIFILIIPSNLFFVINNLFFVEKSYAYSQVFLLHTIFFHQIFNGMIYLFFNRVTQGYCIPH